MAPAPRKTISNDSADKTPAEKQAWLDGYKAATETAKSFRVRVGHEIDDTLNVGAQMVATLLESQCTMLEKSVEPAPEVFDLEGTHTPQQVFDYALKKITEQGCPSLNAAGDCKYAGPNETACAVGIFLDRETAKSYDAIESDITAIVDMYEREGIPVPTIITQHLSLLSDIQHAHDTASHSDEFVPDFLVYMRDVARAHGLVMEDENVMKETRR